MSVIAIVPAVCEPDIDKTLRSLLDQTRSPDLIVVAVNNAADDTTAVAAAWTTARVLWHRVRS